ncbi:hypothetical protein SUDANB66_00079 [Streptomyces sp. SudanB66_2053]
MAGTRSSSYEGFTAEERAAGEVWGPHSRGGLNRSRDEQARRTVGAGTAAGGSTHR